MVDAVALAGKLAVFPFWILWKGYEGLWWAFDDSSVLGVGTRRARGSGVDDTGATPPNRESQDASFQVLDSSLRTPRPKWLLLSGYAGTLAASAGLFFAIVALREVGGVSPGRATAAWMVGTLLSAVLSIFAVRATHRRRLERAAASPLRSATRAARGAAGAVAARARTLGATLGAHARDPALRGRIVTACSRAKARAARVGHAAGARIGAVARRLADKLPRPAPAPKTAPAA